MELRLVARILAVVALVGASLVAMADQSTKFVGVHEIPPFVTERVELPGVPGTGVPLPTGFAQPVKPVTAG